MFPPLAILMITLLLVPTYLLEEGSDRTSTTQASEPVPSTSQVVPHAFKSARLASAFVSVNVTVLGETGPIAGATVNASNPTTGWYALNNTTSNGTTTIMVESAASLIVVAYDRVSNDEILTNQLTLNATASGLPGNVTIEISRPEIPALKVSLVSTNGTCPWNGYTTLLPIASGGVGGYNFTWDIDGVTNGFGPYYNLSVRPPGVSVAVTVLSSGEWYGQYETLPPVTSPVTQIEGTCGFSVGLKSDSSNGSSALSFSWSGNLSSGYVVSSGGIDTLYTDVSDNSADEVSINLPSWASELATSAGYVPPWEEVLIGDGNLTNETGVVLQPQQSGRLVAELPSQVVDCVSGGRLLFALSPSASKAVAADLITLVYADLGVLDPIEQIDPDHGFMAEIIQSEILSLSEQGVLSTLESDLQSGPLSDVLQSLFTVSLAIVNGLLDLPSIIWGAGYNYLTNFLDVGSGDAWMSISEGIGRVAAAAIATQSEVFGYGMLGLQWTSLVQAGFISPVHETASIPEFSCNGSGAGGFIGGERYSPFWLTPPYVYLLILAVVVAIVAIAARRREED